MDCDDLCFPVLSNRLISGIFIFTEAHSLQYYYTVLTPGTNFPEFIVVGLVDGEQIVYYDSTIRKLMAKTEWMRKIGDDELDYWKSFTQEMQDSQEDLQHILSTVMKSTNHTTGVHVLQRMYGCDSSTTGGYDQYGYDGEDFLSLDLQTLTWTVKNDHAKAIITKHKWDSSNYIRGRENFLKNDCVEWLKKFVSYGRTALERKDRPEVSVFHKHFSQPELVCHATGFFPRRLEMSWQKDGEELHKDVEITETVPNLDGTFHRRAVLRVSPEELKEHEYTCVVQHSSLKEDLVLKAPASVDVGGGSLGITVGEVVVAVLALVALVVLVALIAGVLIWKKKKAAHADDRTSTTNEAY
ncbi:BOLA class I histocompatibility antigen, alpha chain BL3-7-like [Trichomycterus rosablanca]|uniref:BOLA class I histocompatibility antigen, alpha chain BL3-7-like n=1 Tax=Trichomycterus rosablanca TaxID=2290929 RepID=UPI002F356BD6